MTEGLSQDETIYINKIEAFLNTFIDKNDMSMKIKILL